MKSKIQNLKSKIPIKHAVQNHPGAALILLAFIILALIYSLVTPPFEAGDESRHYAVVKYMADTGRLPVQEPSEAQIHWSHEGNQPPLYYALAAALTFWIDTGDWNDVYWYNPHTTIGNPLRPDNKNITIHPPGEAWRGHVLAVHLIRFLSITMATVTVISSYFIALSLFKGNRWLAAGAMAITAFNPMFIFISGSVNNDNAVIMFVTLALWLMVQISEWQTKEDKSHSSFTIHYSLFTIRYSPILLGFLIGLGALSKLYALGLLPLAVLLFFWLAYQTDCRLPTADRPSI
ncbi:MAG: phospholipid carrier-dependent glycosyltransferase, partial [Chloroflexi bacterium]|nr:phospholipid carrier-dependent glycosyltransferase [Chloroflexota bacterium]